jgi:hypothetical protein
MAMKRRAFKRRELYSMIRRSDGVTRTWPKQPKGPDQEKECRLRQAPLSEAFRAYSQALTKVRKSPELNAGSQALIASGS